MMFSTDDYFQLMTKICKSRQSDDFFSLDVFQPHYGHMVICFKQQFDVAITVPTLNSNFIFHLTWVHLSLEYLLPSVNQ